MLIRLPEARLTLFRPTGFAGITAATGGRADMRLALILGAMLSVMATAGCVPVVIGAGGAVAADTIAEDRGSDLF